MSRVLLVGLLALLLATPAAAQEEEDGPSGPLGKWTQQDEEQYQRFFRYHRRCEGKIAAGQWSEARAFLKPQVWFIDRFVQRQLADHPKAKEISRLYASCRRRIEARSKTDPGAETSGASYAAPLARGKGRSQTDPGALAALLRDASQLNLREGSYALDKPLAWKGSRLTLRGGYDDAFAEAQPIARPSVIGGRKPRSRGGPLACFDSQGTLHLEGLVFDAGAINRYGAKGLTLRSSPRAPVCELRCSGSVVLRRCVFLNGSGGGLRIIASGQADCRLEHCLFVGGVGPGLLLEGADAEFHVSRCTFALLERPGAKAVAAALTLRSGRLRARSNLFAGCPAGFELPADGVGRVRLYDNAVVALDGPFLRLGKRELSADQTQREVDLDDAEGNRDRRLKVRLGWDRAALLGYLARAGKLQPEQRSWLEAFARKGGAKPQAARWLRATPPARPG